LNHSVNDLDVQPLLRRRSPRHQRQHSLAHLLPQRQPDLLSDALVCSSFSAAPSPVGDSCSRQKTRFSQVRQGAAATESNSTGDRTTPARSSSPLPLGLLPRTRPTVEVDGRQRTPTAVMRSVSTACIFRIVNTCPRWKPLSSVVHCFVRQRNSSYG